MDMKSFRHRSTPMRTAWVVATVAALTLGPTAASAQFFLIPPEFSGPRVTGAEPGALVPPLPNARPEEQRAAVTWSLRSALNVAALQCQFQESLLLVDNYNAILKDHRVELAKTYTVLNGYFRRTTKSPNAAITAFEKYGTSSYSGFSTVFGQLGFCRTASEIAREVLFTKPGGFAEVAANRLMTLRSALRQASDGFYAQRFLIRTYVPPLRPVQIICKTRKGKVKPC